MTPILLDPLDRAGICPDFIIIIIIITNHCDRPLKIMKIGLSTYVVKLGIGFSEGDGTVAGYLNSWVGLCGNFVIGWVTVSFSRKVLRSVIRIAGAVETYASRGNLF
jgi:hypothetical protein